MRLSLAVFLLVLPLFIGACRSKTRVNLYDASMGTAKVPDVMKVVLTRAKADKKYVWLDLDLQNLTDQEIRIPKSQVKLSYGDKVVTPESGKKEHVVPPRGVLPRSWRFRLAVPTGESVELTIAGMTVFNVANKTRTPVGAPLILTFQAP